MGENFRHFEAGPDPFGRKWQVDFLWLQTAIAIRHADTVDVKFRVSSGGVRVEKVVELSHPDLLELSKETGRALTDPWCMKLAGLHLRECIETGSGLEQTILSTTLGDLRRHHSRLLEIQAGSAPPDRVESWT